MRLWCYSPRFIVMRTFTWPIALLLAGLLFQTVAFAVLNTVVPLWMEQFEAATWEAGLVGAFFFLGNLAGTLQTRGILLASYMVVYYLGTVLGQLLLGWFPSDMPLIVTEVCILSVAGMVPLMFARLEPGNGQVSSSSHIEIRTLLRRRSVFLGVVGCVISGVVLGTIYCLMPLFLKHQGMDHSSVGYWMALLIAAAILGQWPMGRLADRYGRAFVMKCQSLLVAAACAGLMLKGGLMAPSLIALGLAGFSLYPVAMAWGCEEASRDELVTMNQLLLLSYSLGTLAGPSLTSFLMQRYSDNWMPMVIALVALSFMPVLMLGGGHGRRKLSR